MPTCQVIWCSNVSGGGGKSTFRFPNPNKSLDNKRICQKWIRYTQNPNFDIKTFQGDRKYVICEDHFTRDSFTGPYVHSLAKQMNFVGRKYLKKGAFPTLKRGEKEGDLYDKKRLSAEIIAEKKQAKRMKAKLKAELRRMRRMIASRAVTVRAACSPVIGEQSAGDLLSSPPSSTMIQEAQQIHTETSSQAHVMETDDLVNAPDCVQMNIPGTPVAQQRLVQSDVLAETKVIQDDTYASPVINLDVHRLQMLETERMPERKKMKSLLTARRKYYYRPNQIVQNLGETNVDQNNVVHLHKDVSQNQTEGTESNVFKTEVIDNCFEELHLHGEVAKKQTEVTGSKVLQTEVIDKLHLQEYVTGNQVEDTASNVFETESEDNCFEKLHLHNDVAENQKVLKTENMDNTDQELYLREDVVESQTEVTELKVPKTEIMDDTVQELSLREDLAENQSKVTESKVLQTEVMDNCFKELQTKYICTESREIQTEITVNTEGYAHVGDHLYAEHHSLEETPLNIGTQYYMYTTPAMHSTPKEQHAGCSESWVNLLKRGLANKRNALGERIVQQRKTLKRFSALPSALTIGCRADSGCENGDISIESEVIVESIKFNEFVTDVKNEFIDTDFMIKHSKDDVQLIQFYDHNIRPAIKLSIVIASDFSCEMFVHRKKVNKSHGIWRGLPAVFDHVKVLKELCERLSKLNIHVCTGNPEEEYAHLVLVGSGLASSMSPEIRAFREGDFHAKHISGVEYSSTIRTVKCELLTDRKIKCKHCIEYGYALKKQQLRLEERLQSKRRYNHTTFKHTKMTCEELGMKIVEQESEIERLQQTICLAERLLQPE